MTEIPAPYPEHTNTEGSSVEAVAAAIRAIVEQLPTQELEEALQQLREASAMLHSVPPDSPSATSHIFDALNTAERSGESAQTLLLFAADALTTYLTGQPGSAPTNERGKATEPSVASIGAAEHPKVIVTKEEAYAAEDQLVPVFGKGNVTRYTSELSRLSDGALCELLRRDLPLADHVLVRRFEGLLWKMAKEEFGKRPLRALDTEDLWIAGVTEFLDSCKRYDPSRGVTLGTYAGSNARNAMKREAVNIGHTVRLPSDLHYEVIHEINIQNAQRLASGRAPMTDEEIARTFNIPLNDDEVRRGDMRTVADIRRAMLLTTYLESLDAEDTTKSTSPDAPYDMDERALRSIFGQEQPDTAEEAIREELPRIIEGMLRELPDRQAEWLRLRFGINGKEHTIQAAAKAMQINTYRADLLERGALHNMRTMMWSRLQEYRTAGESDQGPNNPRAPWKRR